MHRASDSRNFRKLPPQRAVESRNNPFSIQRYEKRGASAIGGFLGPGVCERQTRRISAGPMQTALARNDSIDDIGHPENRMSDSFAQTAGICHRGLRNGWRILFLHAVSVVPRLKSSGF